MIVATFTCACDAPGCTHRAGSITAPVDQLDRAATDVQASALSRSWTVDNGRDLCPVHREQRT